MSRGQNAFFVFFAVFCTVFVERPRNLDFRGGMMYGH